MLYEIRQALNEIMEIPPMYRRDFIIEYMRKYLPEEDARKILFEKTKEDLLAKMVSEGNLSISDLLDKIGRERVEEYFQSTSSMI